MLRAWNERMNLVSRNSFGMAFENHYADSVFIADFAKRFQEGRPFFDLGSGAGFPGLIFAIRYPGEPITLYEKSLKKQGFLSAVVAQLGLSHARIEGGLERGKLQGIFLARAVMQRPELFAFFARHLKPGARICVNLGGKTEATPAPAEFRRLAETQYTLPKGAGNRRLEIYEFVPRGTKK
jgi:16S rRNA (guanine527-N7)-methyltransferase